MDVLLAAALGYLLGSIPFGYLLTRAAGLGDVRAQGSGNIGATNVLRTGSKKLAAATLLLDLAKGFIPVWLAGQIWYDLAVAEPEPGLVVDYIVANPVSQSFAAAGAVLGHCFPVWLKFKGGKGVATNAGVCFGLAWPLGLTYALDWIGVLATLRISSLAGMSAVVCAAIAAALLGYTAFVPVLVLIALLVIWLHRANIARLAKGEEPKVGAKK